MAYNYGTLQATAIRLIASFGREVTIRSYTETGPAYDPTLTPTDTVATAVDVEFNEFNKGIWPIEAHDKNFLISSTSTVDKSNKIVDSDGTVYSIVNLRTIKPGAALVLYDIQARV